MKRQEWQQFHGFTDEEMDHIVLVKDFFNGTIAAVGPKVEQKQIQFNGSCWDLWKKLRK